MNKELSDEYMFDLICLFANVHIDLVMLKSFIKNVLHTSLLRSAVVVFF